MRKPVFGVFDQVRHKPACAATEARKRFEISDIETRGIMLSWQQQTKALIRLRGCAGWSAPLLFAYDKSRFCHDVAHWSYLFAVLHCFLSLTFCLGLSLEAVWVVCHHFLCLVRTSLHFVPCGDCSKTVLQDVSVFFRFWIYNNVISNGKVGNKPFSDADTTFMVIYSLTRDSVSLGRCESRHPCRTPTEVLNQSRVLPLNRTASWALLCRISMTRMMLTSMSI